MTPAKQIVLDILIEHKFDAGQVSVTRGKGTARRWIHVKTEHELPSSLKEIITSRLDAAQLIGSYSDDYGGNHQYPCINFYYSLVPSILTQLRTGTI